MKGKLDEHWKYLLGHAVVIPGREAPILIQRTNYLPEHKFGMRKRGWHRQTGHESLVRVLESARPEQFLLDNLRHPDYLRLLYDGDLRNMPMKFAEHWSQARDLRAQNQGTEVRKKLHVPKDFIRRKDFFSLIENGLAAAS